MPPDLMRLALLRSMASGQFGPDDVRAMGQYETEQAQRNSTDDLVRRLRSEADAGENIYTDQVRNVNQRNARSGALRTGTDLMAGMGTRMAGAMRGSMPSAGFPLAPPPGGAVSRAMYGPSAPLSLPERDPLIDLTRRQADLLGASGGKVAGDPAFQEQYLGVIPKNVLGIRERDTSALGQSQTVLNRERAEQIGFNINPEQEGGQAWERIAKAKTAGERLGLEKDRLNIYAADVSSQITTRQMQAAGRNASVRDGLNLLNNLDRQIARGGPQRKSFRDSLTGKVSWQDIPGLLSAEELSTLKSQRDDLGQRLYGGIMQLPGGTATPPAGTGGEGGLGGLPPFPSFQGPGGTATPPGAPTPNPTPTPKPTAGAARRPEWYDAQAAMTAYALAGDAKMSGAEAASRMRLGLVKGGNAGDAQGLVKQVTYYMDNFFWGQHGRPAAGSGKAVQAAPVLAPAPAAAPPAPVARSARSGAEATGRASVALAEGLGDVMVGGPGRRAGMRTGTAIGDWWRGYPKRPTQAQIARDQQAGGTKYKVTKVASVPGEKGVFDFWGPSLTGDWGSNFSNLPVGWRAWAQDLREKGFTDAGINSALRSTRMFMHLRNGSWTLRSEVKRAQ